MKDGNTPICFERAVLSRSGIGGTPKEILQVLYREVRCAVRNYCKVPIARSGPQGDQSVQVTLVVRKGARAWKNVSDWEEVVKSECAKVNGCQWGIMQPDDLSFCEQVHSLISPPLTKLENFSCHPFMSRGDFQCHCI